MIKFKFDPAIYKQEFINKELTEEKIDIIVRFTPSRKEDPGFYYCTLSFSLEDWKEIIEVISKKLEEIKK